MKILLSTHSLIYNDAKRALELAKELRFDGVELFTGRSLSDFDLQSLVVLQMRHEKKIWNVHVPSLAPLTGRLRIRPMKTWRLHLEKSIEFAEELGAKLLVVHPFPSSLLNGRAKRIMAFVLGELGSPTLDFSIENPGKENRLGMSFKRGLLADPEDLYEFTAGYNIGITLDTSHCAENGMDPSDFFTQYGKQINNIHLSNYARGRRYQSLSDGTINFKRFFRLLKQNNYAGCVTLETEPTNEDTVIRDMRFVMGSLGDREGVY